MHPGIIYNYTRYAGLPKFMKHVCIRRYQFASRKYHLSYVHPKYILQCWCFDSASCCSVSGLRDVSSSFYTVFITEVAEGACAVLVSYLTQDMCFHWCSWIHRTQKVRPHCQRDVQVLCLISSPFLTQWVDFFLHFILNILVHSLIHCGQRTSISCFCPLLFLNAHTLLNSCQRF